MAMKIVEECIACGACEPECPNQAISTDGTTYLVAADHCTECVGAHETQKCIEVCPVDCIIVDPEHTESRDELQAKYTRLHG